MIADGPSSKENVGRITFNIAIPSGSALVVDKLVISVLHLSQGFFMVYLELLTKFQLIL